MHCIPSMWKRCLLMLGASILGSDGDGIRCICADVDRRFVCGRRCGLYYGKRLLSVGAHYSRIDIIQDQRQ